MTERLRFIDKKAGYYAAGAGLLLMAAQGRDQSVERNFRSYGF